MSLLDRALVKALSRQQPTQPAAPAATVTPVRQEPLRAPAMAESPPSAAIAPPAAAAPPETPPAVDLQQTQQYDIVQPDYDLQEWGAFEVAAPMLGQFESYVVEAPVPQSWPADPTAVSAPPEVPAAEVPAAPAPLTPTPVSESLPTSTTPMAAPLAAEPVVEPVPEAESVLELGPTTPTQSTAPAVPVVETAENFDEVKDQALENVVLSELNALKSELAPAQAAERPVAPPAPVPVESAEQPVERPTSAPEPAAAASPVVAVSVPVMQAPAPAVESRSLTWKWPEICQRLLQFTGDGFIALAEQLQIAARNGRRSLGFLSPVRDTGRTSVVLTLAHVFAKENRQKVLLIDADFGHPHIAELVGLTPQVGLWDVIQGKVELAQATLTMTPGQVSLLPFCEPVSELDWQQGAPILRHVLQQARRRYDLILMDAGVVANESVLAECWVRGCVDAVVTVSRERHGSGRPGQEQRYPAWDQVGIEALGVIETFA